jgi:hypothetical protein
MRVAASIATWPIAYVMTEAVDIHSQARLRTIKIENIRTDWMLTAKHGLSWSTFAQAAP